MPLRTLMFCIPKQRPCSVVTLCWSQPHLKTSQTLLFIVSRSKLLLIDSLRCQSSPEWKSQLLQTQCFATKYGPWSPQDFKLGGCFQREPEPSSSPKGVQNGFVDLGGNLVFKKSSLAWLAHNHSRFKYMASIPDLFGRINWFCFWAHNSHRDWCASSCKGASADWQYQSAGDA